MPCISGNRSEPLQTASQPKVAYDPAGLPSQWKRVRPLRPVPRGRQAWEATLPCPDGALRRRARPGRQASVPCLVGVLAMVQPGAEWALASRLGPPDLAHAPRPAPGWPVPGALRPVRPHVDVPGCARARIVRARRTLRRSSRLCVPALMQPLLRPRQHGCKKCSAALYGARITGPRQAA